MLEVRLKGNRPVLTKTKTQLHICFLSDWMKVTCLYSACLSKYKYCWWEHKIIHSLKFTLHRHCRPWNNNDNFKKCQAYQTTRSNSQDQQKKNTYCSYEDFKILAISVHKTWMTRWRTSTEHWNLQKKNEVKIIKLKTIYICLSAYYPIQLCSLIIVINLNSDFN